MICPSKVPNFIYITGCDGTGKSTQARLLLEQLRAKGIKVRHLWLRFPFFFSIPLLVIARLRGYSWYEQTGSVRHGYWDFRHSWMMRCIFPWVLLLDATLAALVKIYLPLWIGFTLVCERFTLDMLVDLSVALADPGFHCHLPGKLYPRLIPREASVTLLDLDPENIRLRRPDLEADRRLEARLVAFRCLAINRSIKVLSSQISMAELNRQIYLRICQ